MTMEIVSGRTGKPHVTSQQFRQFVEGIVGQESYILKSGEDLEPELGSNNLLKIRSGMMAHHGNISSVKIGTYDEVELTNGSQGMKRIDLIVNRYTRNTETEIEKNEWKVIVGTPHENNPVAPAYTVGNLQKGDLVDECPVFAVYYNGINVVEVKKLLSVNQTNKDLSDKVVELNNKILQKYCKTAGLQYYNSQWMHGTVNVGTQFKGQPVQVTLVYGNGYPISQTYNVSATHVDMSGNTEIWAYGTGYIANHVMSVLVRCEI